MSRCRRVVGAGVGEHVAVLTGRCLIVGEVSALELFAIRDAGAITAAFINHADAITSDTLVRTYAHGAHFMIYFRVRVACSHLFHWRTITTFRVHCASGSPREELIYALARMARATERIRNRPEFRRTGISMHLCVHACMYARMRISCSIRNASRTPVDAYLTQSSCSRRYPTDCEKRWQVTGRRLRRSSRTVFILAISFQRRKVTTTYTFESLELIYTLSDVTHDIRARGDERCDRKRRVRV